MTWALDTPILHTCPLCGHADALEPDTLCGACRGRARERLHLERGEFARTPIADLLAMLRAVETA